MRKTSILFILLLINTFQLTFGQEKVLKKMSIVDFIKEYQNNTKPDTLRDVDLFSPPGSDTSFWKVVNNEHVSKIKSATFHNSIVFDHCEFHGPFWGTKLIFCDTFYAAKDTNPCGLSLQFNDCVFSEQLGLFGNFKWLNFTNCDVKSFILLSGYLREVTIKDCKFSNIFRDNLHFSNCVLDHANQPFNLLTMRTLNFLNNENLSASFENCKFSPSKKGELINMGNCNYENLFINGSEFFIPVTFEGVKIEKGFEFEKNKIDDFVQFTNFDSPISTSTIRWKDLSHKLCLITDTVYSASNDSDLLEDDNFNELQTSYNFFTNLYSAKGDVNSRNAVYIEKKQLSTARAKALFHHHKTLYNYLNFQFNSFLNWFCDYATNPVKALLNCFYVMFIFAAFYFIFPSLPDHLSRYKFIGYFDKSIEYFTHDKSLADIHKEAHHEHLMELNRFKGKLKETKGMVPKVITICGQLFLYTHHFVFEFLNRSLLSLDLCKKNWKKVTGGKKIILGFLAGIYFIGFIINGVIMRAINSVTLSLNSFVTLGAAGIETRGLARYITVLEGSVGWFFLTIFAVTLITQLLQ